MTATGTEARICELIAKRQELGTKKYGTTVAENPLGLVQWMKHFRDELLDGVIYVQRAIEQIEGVPEELTPEQRMAMEDPVGYIAEKNRQAAAPKFGEVSPPSPMGICHGDVHLSQSVTLEDGSTLTATGPVQNDPHAELKKQWRPGQVWQNKFPDQGDDAWATYERGVGITWWPSLQYRRHPDDIDPPEEKPWYPDDSGEWVEVHDDWTIRPVPSNAMVKTLTWRERNERLRFEGGWMRADRWAWDLPVDSSQRIVAYRLAGK